jgi:endonuclease-3
MLTKKRSSILSVLTDLYPDPRSELHFTNEYELLISVVLSAQCTDKKVNQTTPELFGKFNNFRALSKASLEVIENIIRPINYYRTKSKNIIETAKLVSSLYEGAVPHTMDELIELPGVGRKTANVILGELGIQPSIAVDTHVFRVSKRLGVAVGETPLEVEESLKKNFPPESWRDLHHRLIFHGRRVCKARSPECGVCSLRELCPSRE